MRKLLAAVLAALAVPALALLPAGAASAGTATPCITDCTTPQPEGAQFGWTLVENETGQEIYDASLSSTGDWVNVSGDGHEYCNSAGNVGYDASNGALELTTGGASGNCARVESTWTIAPTSAAPIVWIEYEATLPTNTWAALWATGDPGPWPTTGEIDTAEMLGEGMECHTYHYGSPPSGSSLGPGDPDRCETGTPGSEAVYGVEWSAGQLTFYVNGVKTDQFSNSVITADPEQVVLDNKTGGFDPGPNGPTSTLDVYYVRAWECKAIDGLALCTT
jgi:hypothetical protein